MKRTKKYLATICYDGSFFSGWAKQTNVFTVQGFIEKAISSLFSLDKFKILASSRTDKGVHALDQKFTFSLPFNLSSKNLFFVLRKKLQEFIVLNKVREISPTFHPLYNIQLKEYRYYINTGIYNLFLKNYCWNYNSSISIFKLRKLLRIFEGFHDFFNFSYCRIRDQAAKNTCRKIEKIFIYKNKDFFVVRILAKNFVRYQIRAMIGEAVTTMNKPNAYENLSKMLNPNFPQKYKTLAPAGGLYLWKINFSKDWKR